MSGAAGFRRAPLRVEFGPGDLDGSLDGFWVEMRRLSTRELRELKGIEERAKAGEIDEVEFMVGKLADGLIAWNWADPATGEPVDPRAPGAIDTLDSDILMTLLDMWQAKAVGVPADLGKGFESTPGTPGRSTSPAPIPVTGTPGLSSALASLPTHSGPSAS